MGKKTQPPASSLPELKKGMLLVLKVPPYYTKEYLYEIASAGDKLLRASLYRSPTVRKNWTKEELQALFDNGLLRVASQKDLSDLTNAPAPVEPD